MNIHGLRAKIPLQDVRDAGKAHAHEERGRTLPDVANSVERSADRPCQYDAAAVRA